MVHFLLMLISLATINGCATVISEESRKLVDPIIQFSKLRENPDSYIGKNILAGGRIIGAKNTKEGAVIEIVQFELSGNGLPEVSSRTSGRFLATSVDFLETTIFKRGRLITLVGEIKGKKILPIDEIEYVYPVVALREYYLWKDPDYEKDMFYPPLPYYTPDYFGSGTDPYWTRPSEPVLKRWQ